MYLRRCRRRRWESGECFAVRSHLHAVAWDLSCSLARKDVGRSGPPRMEPSLARGVNVALLLVVAVAGCETTKPSAKPAPPAQASAPIVGVRAAPATRPVGPSEASVVVEEPGSTPQSLATDAAAYARAIEK